MNGVYFDVSNVRGFAENLHYRYENEYKQSISAIRGLLTGGSEGETSGNHPMGNIDAEYYGRDIARVQSENAVAAVQWLDHFQASLIALINAALVTSEELNNTDGDNAAAIDGFHPSYESRDYRDPGYDPTR